MATTKQKKTKRLPDPNAVYYIAMFEDGETIAGVVFDDLSDSCVILGLSLDETCKAARAAVGSSSAGKTVVIAEMRDVQRFRINVIPSRVELEPVNA